MGRQNGFSDLKKNHKTKKQQIPFKDRPAVEILGALTNF